jgi:hypothetical protein
MRLSGTQSWAIREDDAQWLVMALYVRDAAGLDTSSNPDAPPPLDPPVAVDEVWRSSLAGLAAAWNAWWSRLLRELATAPSEPAAFADAVAGATGDVRRLLDATLPAAESWQRDQDRAAGLPRFDPQQALWLGTLVRAIEAELGCRAAPFRLAILTLPVRGLWSMPAAIGEEVAGRPGLQPSPALLLSRQLRSDDVELERVLRPFIIRGILGADGL